MNRTLHRTILSTMLGGLALSAVAFAGGGDMFMQADADRDGRVSAREHAAAAQAMFALKDADRDGSLVAAELAAGHGMRMRDGKRGHGREKMRAGMMARMDADRDGAITRAEHAAASQAMFDRMDADRDGRVTAEEMKGGHAKMMADHGGMKHKGMRHEGMRHEGMKPHPGKGMHGHGMARMDANGDGRVTVAEHAAAAQAMFLRMDADRDGYVSKAEIQAGHGIKQPR